MAALSHDKLLIAIIVGGKGRGTNLAALAQAKQEHKLVMLDFTGSDWCGWCIKLNRDVFSKPEFAKYAKE